MKAPGVFDVVICGGGLAGLTLARQLRSACPKAEVLLIERSSGMLPEACFKVGESVSEVAARYFTRDLGLKAYLRKSQLRKLGVRFFFEGGRAPLEARPEFGPARYAADPTYQLDRGLLENDLRRMNREAGVRALEGCAIEDIVLGEGGAEHRVVYREPGSAKASVVLARWVIDATGRKRLLQSKLGLKLDNGHRASAAWFRLKGRVDVEDMVPRARRAWHARVPGRIRYFSTNHLMGKGYWVWLIPLSTGHTSIGIVADERLHPFQGYGTLDAARRWLKAREPRLFELLRGREPLDFKRMKHFSYSSRRVFSPDRWACVGEAGVFVDPFYSPGSDFIAIGNSFVARMVAMDLEGTFRPETAEHFNSLFLGINAGSLDVYRDMYPVFGDTRVMTAKLLWDWVSYRGFTVPLYFEGLLARPELGPRIAASGARLSLLNRKMQRLFLAWAAKGRAGRPYGYLDPRRLPLLRSLEAALAPKGGAKPSVDEVFRRIEATAGKMETLARALMEEAAEDGVAVPASSGAPVRGLAAMRRSLRRVLGRRSARSADSRSASRS